MKTLHGGVSYTMAEIRREFWIPRLRRLTKTVVKECHGCLRFHTMAFPAPPPGGLPHERTEGVRPFQVIGVDYAGPLRYQKSKKCKGKAYFLLYCCSLTRAVYIELLCDQTIDELIPSLKRFIARRGRPEKIYSDTTSQPSCVRKSGWNR